MRKSGKTKTALVADAVVRVHGLGELKLTGDDEDPTLMILEVQRLGTVDVVQDRVTQFVLDSINYTGDGGLFGDEGEEAVGEKFLFYMSPITRSMFETYFNQAQDQLRQQGFNTM